jgi:outer membrane protein assembly factor BamB
LLMDDVAVSGFDNGRVMAVALRDGSTVWDVAVSPPSGRTELERLVDVDSTIKALEDDVYAVTFQGKVARLARDSGQIWWARDVSSYRGLAVDDDGVYVSNADGQIIKIGRRTGVEIWRKDTLKNRRPSAPVVLGGVVIVTDFDGVVHAFDTATGEETGRVKGGGKLVSTPPAVADGLVLFMNDQGKLTAWRIGKSRRG